MKIRRFNSFETLTSFFILSDNGIDIHPRSTDNGEKTETIVTTI